ncbi:MAG: hypothetical protein JW749_10265 [Sedimentisphaerales bacterium]|nr:hypothetical protein [Sedimentisphaerales bacterium]
MKKCMLLAAVVIFSTIAPALAEETPDGDIHGKVGITYDSLYVWRGILVYGADSAIHPFVDLDLMGSGFHLEAVAHRANDSGHENAERWDYSLYYMGALNMEDAWETRYLVGYRYFNFPELSSHRAFKSLSDIGSVDLQELYAGFAFPRLLGVQGLVPGYVILKTWPSNSGTLVGGANPNGGTYSGWAHVFMLDYAMKLEGMSAETPSQTINFHVETVFNDGVDPRPAGGYTSSDWTHVMMGVSTDFDLGEGVTFTPALYHQVTMEDDKEKGVSPDHDITWASATLKYTF